MSSMMETTLDMGNYWSIFQNKDQGH